ncbi:amino acid--tRNA ligase-related protein [Burkholderia pseudomallei]|uniref:amino acid--tRNA ligase-related protein n=1 Tax=Burkholderia pseudomallei TaxID=28450 RepID=UPI001414EECC|nr:amino acid--tRNA ligase-related protein [Burkholderia pseudomallei]
MSSKNHSGISFPLIVSAYNFFMREGFTPVCAPMTVSKKMMDHTCPPGVRDRRLRHIDGSTYVASAEQSFLQMEVDGDIDDSDWLMAITPCYRDDDLDDTHFNIFLKVELFAYNMDDFELIAGMAYKFWTDHVGLPVTKLKTPDGIDIMYGDLELGSFGTRLTTQGIPYVYGTGVAEPRGSMAITMENERDGTCHRPTKEMW